MLLVLMLRPGKALADFTVNQRVFFISALALVVGLFASIIAVALIWLINVVTNLAFFFRFSAEASSPANSHLGLGLILVPVAGSLIIGLMARYGSEKIRGHGIPEALEAILLGRSRLDVKVAVLKPLSSAVAIASITAGTARRFLLGNPPIFPILHHLALPPTTLWQAAVIGLVVGFASAGLTVLVYFFEDRFGQLRIHWMWWPALGGLVVGLGGLIEPRVLGVGYDTIHALLNGTVSSPDLVKIAALKALIWAVALGSGTSGGVLAPLLMMGGAVGTLLALPDIVPPVFFTMLRARSPCSA